MFRRTTRRCVRRPAAAPTGPAPAAIEPQSACRMNSLATTCSSTNGPVVPNGVIAATTAHWPTVAVRSSRQWPSVRSVTTRSAAAIRAGHLPVIADDGSLARGKEAEQRARGNASGPLPHRITMWRLDFDDISAGVSEHLAAVGGGDTAREFHDSPPCKRRDPLAAVRHAVGPSQLPRVAARSAIPVASTVRNAFCLCCPKASCAPTRHGRADWPCVPHG